MQVSLYTVTQELREMLDSAFDPETGEALPMFEEKRALWGSKATGVAAYILNTEDDIMQCSIVLKRVNERKAALERKAERIKHSLAENMKITGISEVKGQGFCARLYIDRDESVELDENATFPPELCADPKPPAPSKTKIKAAILAGEPVAGARIVRKDRLALK